MKIIRPITVTDAVLTSSNVPENDYTAFDPAVIYAAGDFVRYVAANAHKIYQSISGSRSTVSMTIAAPCVVNWNSHGLAAGTPFQLSTTGALPTGLTAGTTYYVLSPTTNSFNVAATVGGAAINTTGTQSGVHTAVAGNNLAQTPPNVAYWIDAGATNRWRIFDQSITSQTSNPDTIVNTLTISGRADSVVLLNSNAASGRVTMTDAIDGVVYDSTFNMVSNSGIQDWYAWTFEPIVRIQDKAITDMPPYANAVVAVTLTDIGGTPLCGGLVIGQSKDIGGTQYGAKVGIQDYSTKQRDAFGNYTILQRAFNKRADFTVWVLAAYVDALENLLATYRAIPIVYIGVTTYGSTIIYGFYKDFSVDIAYPTESICTIQLEGLT
jgi:hypothetical protein